MDLIDTHQHLWDLSRFPYRWCQGIPQLNRSFLPQDYTAAAAGTGITRTVFMECDVDSPFQLDEARAVAEVADSGSWTIAGIVASGRPESPSFESHLDALSAVPKVRGLRRVLHTQPDELSQTPLFAKNVRLLAQRNYTFDLCLQARQLHLGEALARACPEVTFIVDHCGVPDVKSGAIAPWRESMKALAALPNVTCKLSGIVAYGAGPDPAALRPWFETCIELFGWNRVVWGSDWPVCSLGAPLATWVELTKSFVSTSSPENRAALFSTNAIRIYRL